MEDNKGKLIFFVDDSETVAELISRSIRKSLGHHVRRFGKGEEMLRAMEEEMPGLVLLDCYLDIEDPEAMNGMQVLQRIREMNPDLPVLILSGLTDEKIATELLENGAQEILDKHDEEVLYTMEQIFPKYL